MKRISFEIFYLLRWTYQYREKQIIAFNTHESKTCFESQNYGLESTEIKENNEFRSEEGFEEVLHAIACKLTSLTENEREMVKQTLRKYRLLLSNKPGCAKGYEHKLNLATSRSSIRHTYPVPYQLREPTRQAIEKIIQNGVIERAVSQYSSPLRIVSKEYCIVWNRKGLFRRAFCQ